jgi:hypothetical protein
MSIPPALIRLVKIAICTAATLAALFVCLVAYISVCSPPTFGGANFSSKPEPCTVIFNTDDEPNDREVLQALTKQIP